MTLLKSELPQIFRGTGTRPSYRLRFGTRSARTGTVLLSDLMGSPTLAAQLTWVP